MERSVACEPRSGPRAPRPSPRRDATFNRFTHLRLMLTSYLNCHLGQSKLKLWLGAADVDKSRGHREQPSYLVPEDLTTTTT